MSGKLTPCEKAGRVIRLIAWIQIATIIGLMTAMVIPIFAEHKTPHVTIILALPFLIPLLYFKVGKAIKEHKNWGRTVGIIMGILMIPVLPIGTLIGAYILWCLIKGWDQQPA